MELSFIDNNIYFQSKNKETTTQWTEIKTILAYKADLFTYDMICLEISLYNGSQFTITEELAQWDEFIEQLKRALPNINGDWYYKVMLPPFATNLTVIYDKMDRDLQEILKDK